MERLIEELEKDLIRAIGGNPLGKKRKELGDNVDIRFCRMIVFSLLWASVGYQSALRFAGMKLGKSMGTKSSKSELGLILTELKQIFEVMKQGRVEFEVLPVKKRAKFRVFEGAISTGVPDILQNLCFFEEGFIEGYLDGVVSKSGSLLIAGFEEKIQQLSVTERKCVGLGDEYCEFLIKF